MRFDHRRRRIVKRRRLRRVAEIGTADVAIETMLSRFIGCWIYGVFNEKY